MYSSIFRTRTLIEAFGRTILEAMFAVCPACCRRRFQRELGTLHYFASRPKSVASCLGLLQTIRTASVRPMGSARRWMITSRPPLCFGVYQNSVWSTKG